MFTDPIIVGAVLMGGESRRFGSDKALADVNGTAMGARVAGALRDAGLDPVVAVGGSAGPTLGLVTIPDRRPGAGPLAALASVLGWASRGGVVVVPCDHPTLDVADISALIAAFENDQERPAVGVVDGIAQVGVACWPASFARPAQRLVDTGESRYRAALDIGPITEVAIGAASAVDADDPTALRAALESVADHHGARQ